MSLLKKRSVSKVCAYDVLLKIGLANLTVVLTLHLRVLISHLIAQKFRWVLVELCGRVTDDKTQFYDRPALIGLLVAMLIY